MEAKMRGSGNCGSRGACIDSCATAAAGVVGAPPDVSEALEASPPSPLWSLSSDGQNSEGVDEAEP